MEGSESNSGVMEVLAFTPGGKEYGIDILKMQEIRGYDRATRIANAPGMNML